MNERDMKERDMKERGTKLLFSVHSVVVSSQTGGSSFFGGMMVIGVLWRGAFLHFVKSEFVDEPDFRRFRFHNTFRFFLSKRIATESFGENTDPFSSDLIKLMVRLGK